jgi:KDO2-lipid IV(A) lauroyltransferase
MANRSEAARRRRRYVGYPLEAAFLYLIYGIFMVLPLDTASALGGWIGRTIGPRLRTSRKARRNLDRAMPELSEARRDEIITGMWDNLGRVMAEYPHLDQIWTRTDMIGGEIVDEIAASRQKPTLFFSAHTGNWEVGLLGAARHGLHVTAVYRRPNNPATSWLINKARSAIGSRMVPKGRDGAREVVATLRNKGAVCIMIDQKMNDGIPVPFFGRDAMTAPALGQLAFKYDCAVVPVFVERLEGAHFRLTVSPPLELIDSGDRNADVRSLMTRVNQMVEDRVRARPEQWLWLHRRWPD